MNINDVVAKYATTWLGRQVDRVEPTGSDWAGSTEDGFHSTFEMYLVGPDVSEYLEGARLQEFWDFVLKQALA